MFQLQRYIAFKCKLKIKLKLKLRVNNTILGTNKTQITYLIKINENIL